MYNVRVGDSAFGWLADMVQPGVSIRNSQDIANNALNTLSCLGDEARVVSGAALGAKGTVIGKSGRFAEHVDYSLRQGCGGEDCIGGPRSSQGVGPQPAP